MAQLIFRFVVGGLMVSVFAAFGDALKPKSFAGLFGAAPSIALATLSLTIVANGKLYAAMEARSMVLGAFCFSLYAAVCCRLMMKNKWSALSTTIPALILWLACAVGAWALLLR
jgi:hypothetical protein